MYSPSPLLLLWVNGSAIDRQGYDRGLPQAHPSGCEVVLCETALEALEWCQSHRPDVILLDCAVSDFNGLGWLQRFQGHPNTAHAAVIGLVGGKDASMAIQLLRGGAQDCLVKDSLTPEELQESIHRALTRMDQVQENEARFRSAFEQVAVGMAHVLPSGQFIRLNQRFCEIVGYPAAVLRTLTLQDMIYPADLNMDLDLVQTLLVGPPRISSVEKRCVHQDGSLVWINLTISGAGMSAGKPTYLIATVEDISQRRMDEIALQQAHADLEQRAIQLEASNQNLQIALEEVQVSEEELQIQNEDLLIANHAAEVERQRYEDLFDFAPDGYLVTDARGLIQEANRAAAFLLATNIQSLLGKPLFLYVPAAERRDFNTLLHQAQQSSHKQIFELTLQPRQGELFPAEIIATAMHNAQGQIVGVRWLIQNIRDRKQAAAALAQEARRTRALLDSCVDGIVVLQEHRVVEANPRFAEMLGYSMEEIASLTVMDWEAQWTSAEVDALVSQWQEEGKTQRTFETWHRRKDGSVFAVEITVNEMEWDGSRFQFCVCRDITERKQVEEHLRESEQRLRLALMASKQGLYDLNMQTGDAVVSPEYAMMLGYDPATFQETNAKWIARLHPEDHDPVAQVYQAYVAGEIPEYKVEFRQRTASGEWKWILSLGKIVVWDAEGNPLRMLGTHTDISDRKRLETELTQAAEDLRQLNRDLEARVAQRTAELQASQAQLLALAQLQQAILDSADYSIISTTPEGLIQTFNAAAQTMLGYRADAVINQTSPDRLFHDPHELQQQAMRLSAELGRPIAPNFEVFAAKPNQGITTEGEWTYIRKDGTRFPVILSITALRDPEGQIQGYLGISKDITQHKQLEAQFQSNAAHLAAAQRIAHLGSWELDLQTWAITWSEEVFRIFGRDPELGPPTYDTFLDNFLPPDRDRYRALMQQAIDQTQTYEAEYRFSHPDGQIHHMVTRGEVVVDETGEAIRLMGTILDISDRKQAEAALRESERRFATLAEASPVAIFQYDALGSCVYVNYRWSEITGRPIEEGMGRGWVQTLHPDDCDRILTEWMAWAQTCEPGSLYRNEGRILRPDGSVIWFYCQIMPELDAAGALMGYVGILADISDRKQVEEQLRRINEQLVLTNAELARATRLKDEFLANMSHELRTPLTSILGMSDILEEEIFGTLNEKQHQYVGVIAQSGRHLLTLINDILDLAKIESGRLELQIEAASVQELCASSITFVRQIAYNKKIQLHTSISPQVRDVYVDELRIRQALINLLSNAVKFTPEGGQVTLEVERDRTLERIQFSVVDTGIGIAPEDMPKLFQSFVQVDSSLSRQYGGTGLGLALVKQIVELHHGQVDVASTLGQGSRFSIYLPEHPILSLAQAQATPDVPLHRPPEGTRMPALQTAQPLILLAEDNQANIDTFSNYLLSYGYRVQIATTGQEAVDLARGLHPDLILMDIQMPGIDGLEATRQIRDSPGLAQIPIIALTALAMVGDRDRCLAAGVTDYLMKPVKLKQLVEMIEKLCKQPEDYDQ